jgi:hypothetical protein
MSAAPLTETAAEPTRLERLVRQHFCRSTHHIIALDALSRLTCRYGDDWKRVMLAHHDWYLKGAKAPDDTFKDFQNHVCHVTEGLWGGAPAKAMEWYARAVEHLTKKQWREAAYALGVTSHYYADPLMPFHTGQTEEEGVIHRAVEWSIAKSRPVIDRIIQETGYPEVIVPEGPGFVADMVLDGAALSNAYYQKFIDHYDFKAGSHDPLLGLDDELRASVAHLRAYATEGFARIVSRAIEEAKMDAPDVNLAVRGWLELLEVPGALMARARENAADKKAVRRNRREFDRTGKVIHTLSDDDKFIRAEHARVVRRVSLKVLDAEKLKPIGTKHAAKSALILTRAEAAVTPALEQPAAGEPVEAVTAAPPPAPLPAPETKLQNPERKPLFAKAAKPVEDTKPAAISPAASLQAPPRAPAADDFLFERTDAIATDTAPVSSTGRRPSLSREDNIVEAPSIGRKTAKKFLKAGIETVGDFLDLDAEEAAYRVDLHYADGSTMRDWQDQARLMCTVPGLRAHDAQILVGAGIRNREELAEAPARTLFQLAREFLSSPEGEHVQRDDEPLAEAEIEEWIDLAKEAA